MLLTVQWKKDNLCHIIKKRGIYIIFSDQESQNFLLHSISLRFICLQLSIELLWYREREESCTIIPIKYDKKANRVTNVKLTQKLLHAISSSLPGLVVAVVQSSKKALKKCWQRTQSTFFLASNHVNSSYVHINSQCFDKTIILKITMIPLSIRTTKQTVVIYIYIIRILNLDIKKRKEDASIHYACVFSLHLGQTLT